MLGWRDGYYRRLLMQVSGEEEHLDDPETYITLKIGERRHQPTLTEPEEMENTYAAVQRNLQADGRPRQLLGKTVGGYRVLFALEQQGGMAEVYVAKWGDSVRNSYVLKASKRNGGTRQPACCFEEEAEALGQIQDDTHLATFAASGFDEAHQVDFIVTERVEGRSLHKLVRCVPQGQPFPEIPASEAVGIILQALQGVSELHRLRIIHRDLTPCNIILGRDGVAKVIDLGLAVHLPEEQNLIEVRTTAAGTPWFRPPEQEESGDRQVGFCSDVYSLGKTLYFLLKYRPRWEPTRRGEKGQWPSDQLLQTDAELWEGIEPDLTDVIQTAVHPSRERRYQTVQAFSEALRRFALATSSPESLIGRLQYPPPDDLLDLAIGEDLAKLGSDEVSSSDATSTSQGNRVGRFVSCLRRWLPLMAGGLLLAVILGVTTWAFQWGSLGRDRFAQSGNTQPDEAANHQADVRDINVRVLEKGNPRRNGILLEETEALPLKPVDLHRIEVALTKAGYVYLVLVEPDGEVYSLYPWEDFRFTKRTVGEEPTANLAYPPRKAVDPAGEVRYQPVPKSLPGMLAVMAFTRETPLPADVDLGKELGKAPRQVEAFPHPRLWFKNGVPVRDIPTRAPDPHIEIVSDAVVGFQESISKRLVGEKKLFRSSMAVAFVTQGRK